MFNRFPKHERNLFDKLAAYLAPSDLDELRAVLDFAEVSHAGQVRRSGEPYITHPIAAAEIVADYRLDKATLAAALLHDVPEDTDRTLGEIEERFGQEIAGLVDGVTKLSQVRLKKNWADVYPKVAAAGDRQENFNSFDRHVETLRKMFLAMSQDIRVVLIKLADRLHNMRTIEALEPEKRSRIAQETLQVYAPLASRLGIGTMKGELEDLSFPHAHPDEYHALKQLVFREYRKRVRYIERVRRILLKRLAKIGLRAEVHGRAKHMYSLWKKLTRNDDNLAKIHDLVATRIIVESVEECYQVLGMVHRMWRPLPGRIKDYIAFPKPNGYQSLHTTVFASGGMITEIQIRTRQMHYFAEFGIAAHWAYKEQPDEAPQTLLARVKNRLVGTSGHHVEWLEELAKTGQAISDPAEWRKGLTLDFFQDRIFVFTPNGDILDLPSHATPIDFAYAIHSDLGDHCTGAKINGRIVPLSYQLENGDIVEIMTQKKTSPRRDWLNLAKSSKARAHIRRAVN